MKHTSEALQDKRIENVIARMDREGDIQAAETVRALRARVQELEQQLANAHQSSGAEAYDIACEEMEAYQLKRAQAGKEVGCTGSLVDGIGWVYERLEELEAELEATRKDPLTYADWPM